MRLPFLAMLLMCASCLDFGQFQTDDGAGGQGGQGGQPSGGQGAGGENVGGAEPVCPTDPPTETCITRASGFNGEDTPEWKIYPTGPLSRTNCTNGSQDDCGLKVQAPVGTRRDLRTENDSSVDVCSASIRIEEQAEAAWTFLELAPDEDDVVAPDLSERAEIAVKPGRIRFYVAGEEKEVELPGVTTTVDALRIQVREDGLALEAFVDGRVVGCFLADRPSSWDSHVRIGIGVDARGDVADSAQSSTFDDYGFAP